MKKTLLLITTSFLLISCSVFNNDEQSEFTAIINGDILVGKAIYEINKNELFMRGYENGDQVNGRYITINVDDFNGPGTYEISSYSYAGLVGGDVAVSIARSYTPNGKIEVKKADSSNLDVLFSGTFISRDSSEVYEGDIIFNVNN